MRKTQGNGRAAGSCQILPFFEPQGPGKQERLTRDMLVRSCISKSTAMPLFRVSLAFQHNSWAKRCRLPHLSSFYTCISYWNIFPYKMAGTKVPVPCVPPTAAHLLTWTFVIYHAAMKMKTLAFCNPAIYFPIFTSRFGRHSFPYSSLYRSLVLSHPTLLSLGMYDRCKATKFQEQVVTDFYGASKTEQVPKWNCP